MRTGRPAEVLPPEVDVDELLGACPGMPGRLRVHYGTRNDLNDARQTEWATVGGDSDFTHQFVLDKLEPATEYHYEVESANLQGEPHAQGLKGRFRTAPPPDVPARVTFTVITGQAYGDLDHPDGYHIYPAMMKLDPHFIVPTGDTVYYDSEAPRATTIAVARHHWHRMYSLPRLVEFHLRVPGCWEKDDHDTLSNDCWPLTSDKNPFEHMLPMTFEDGLRIFREQVPMSPKTYRTFRWGKDLQVWLVEGRDFRSPNTMPDGPEKTIWGKQQKRWLRKTILESDATFKVLVSPTPVVGPDRRSKADNHANKAFSHEGDEIRSWIQEHVADHFFFACGDRHWQYHSVHPETKVHEFSCGPASDCHAGGSPGKDPEYHRFHRVKGGFLSVTVERENDMPLIRFCHHDVHGEVVYKYESPLKP